MQTVGVSLASRLAALVMIVAASVVVASASPVLAVQGPELLRGSNVVELPPVSFDVKPGTAKRELLQGERVRETCRFSLDFHAENGDTTPQMAKMIAIEPDSCVAEIERGEPATLPEIDSERREASSEAFSVGDVGAEGQNANRKSTYWTIWEDPVLARVAVVRTSVRSIVENKKIQQAKCTVLIDPLEQTGWQIDRDSREFDCNWSSRRATSVASVNFFNDDFLGAACSGRERTHVFVVRNTAKVTRNDESGVVQITYADGGCSNLLGLVRFFEPGVYYN